MYLKQKKKKKIYILFSRTSLFLFFIHFIKSGHSFTLILTLSRSSLIPLKLHSLNVATVVKLTPVRYNLLLLFFFLFFFSFYQIRSHSLSPVHRHLSSQASQAHSLNVAAIVKFRPTPPICLDALLFRRFASGQSLSSSCGCFGFLIWVYSSADPLWVFDLDPLHVDVSVFYF